MDFSFINWVVEHAMGEVSGKIRRIVVWFDEESDMYSLAVYVYGHRTPVESSFIYN